MNESTPAFRTVMRGYDPAEVDRRIAELSYAAGAEQQRARDLQRQVDELAAATEAARQQADTAPATPAEPDFTALGSRVGQILSLAEAEAAQIREDAASQVLTEMAAVETATGDTRASADHYAADTRLGAEREAARIVEDAKRTSDQLLDDADRQASARRQEAEAIHEQQRASAAQAATDFEGTLAERRDRAEHEFHQRTALAEQQLAATQEHVARLRAQTDQTTADATRRAATAIAEAEQKAEQIVAEAVARADRIRSESERELAAASQRRDSINAQLTNVRHMLATLSGTGPAAFGGDSQSASTAPPAGTSAQAPAPSWSDQVRRDDGDVDRAAEATAEVSGQAPAADASDDHRSDDATPQIDEATRESDDTDRLPAQAAASPS
ncbi:MAG: hypothetical protein ABJA87_07025 [bacterium]